MGEKKYSDRPINLSNSRALYLSNGRCNTSPLSFSRWGAVVMSKAGYLVPEGLLRLSPLEYGILPRTGEITVFR